MGKWCKFALKYIEIGKLEKLKCNFSHKIWSVTLAKDTMLSLDEMFITIAYTKFPI